MENGHDGGRRALRLVATAKDVFAAQTPIISNEDAGEQMGHPPSACLAGGRPSLAIVCVYWAHAVLES